MGCFECKLKEKDLSLDKLEEEYFSHISLVDSFRDIRLVSHLNLENEMKEMDNPKILDLAPYRLGSVSTTKTTNLELGFTWNSPLFSEQSLTLKTALLPEEKSRTLRAYQTEPRLTFV